MKSVKGFRTPAQPTKGEVQKENQTLAQNLSSQLQFVANMATQAIQAARQLSPEVDALTSLEASNIVSDGEVQVGDHVMMDYLGCLMNEDDTAQTDEDGLPAYQQSMIGIKFCLRGLGRGTLIPGFEEQLIGKKVGETFEVNVKFPDEYGSDDVKGKKAKFMVTIHRIYRSFATSPVEKAIHEFQAAKNQIQAQKQAAAQAATPAEESAPAESPAPEASPQA